MSWSVPCGTGEARVLAHIAPVGTVTSHGIHLHEHLRAPCRAVLQLA